MTTINLELRSIKHMASMSEETFCYSATVYLNGKAVCDVYNEGHGGCDMQRWRDRAAEATITAYFKSLPPEDTGMRDPHDESKPFMLERDLEGWCGDQVTRFLTLRDIKRMIGRKTIVAHPTGEEFAWKIPPADLARELNFRDKGKMTGAAYVLAKSPAGSRIVNLMTAAELEAYVDELLAKQAEARRESYSKPFVPVA